MSVINNKHLASHGLTAESYRAAYPGAPLMSEVVAAKLSARSVKSNASRKGVPRAPEHLAAIRAAVAARPSKKGIAKGPMSEETRQKLSAVHRAAFAEGRRVPSQLGRSLTPETREKIAASLKDRTVRPEIAAKTIATKRERGMDLAFMRGRKHTEEARRKIGEASSARFAREREQRRQPMLPRIGVSGLTLTGALDDAWLSLRCNACGHEFRRRPQMFQPSKWHAEICEQCFPASRCSAAEQEIAELVARAVGLDVRVLRSDWDTLSPLELDIHVPDRKVAIEYCGLWWHSEIAGKHKLYHKMKRERCEALGIRLITVFEDEWHNKRDLVERAILRALGAATHLPRLDARRCLVVELEPDEANAFLRAHHMQGRGRATKHLGLRSQGTGALAAVMTFNAVEISRRRSGWEINRFCTSPDFLVRGAGGRLFAHFTRTCNPSEVISYADLRWGTGDVYAACGFGVVGDTVPGYWYFRSNELRRHHRYGLRKTVQDPKDETEWSIRQREGWNRIFDCGHRKWLWTPQGQ